MSALMGQSALTERPAKRMPAWPRVLPSLLLPVLLCCLPLFGAALPVGANAPQNSISSIRTVVTGGRLTTYDIAVTSTAEFPMGDAVVTLCIGSKEFINSSYAPGGTLNTLVFSLTRSQFLGLKNGAPVAVYYGEDNAAIPAAQWNFGTLNLRLLDRGVIGRPILVSLVKNGTVPSLHAANIHAASPQKGKK
jgi:hypothetical protein